MSKGYYILTGCEFLKHEILQNLVYLGSHLVLVKKVFTDAPNLSTWKGLEKGRRHSSVSGGAHNYQQVPSFTMKILEIDLNLNYQASVLQLTY